MKNKQLHTYVFEARRLYMKDTGFKITSKGVQFYPNETSDTIEDFYMPITEGMINADVFVEVEKIATAIRKWREYEYNNREIHVSGDQTLGRD